MMEYIIYIYWCMFVTINLTTGKPAPPTDVQVNVTGDAAYISWKIGPTVRGTRIYGPNIPTAERFVDIKSPTTSYVMEGILQYKTTIGMMVYSPTGWSDKITITFWKTDTNVYSKRGSNVSLTFKSDSEIYTLVSPTDAILFSITFGYIVNNTGDDRFIPNKTSDGLSLSLSNIQPTDAGGYRLEEDQQVLVITEKPATPALTSDKVGFDGEELHLTCESSVQRWPTYLSSSLQYKFSTEGEKHGNKLSINITRQDKGKQIYCQATDDRGDVSNNSNIFTLDPYYGPDKPVLTYEDNQLNITEGSNMTAIKCSADCYPQCSYEWKRKRNGDTQFQLYKHGQTLEIIDIKRQDSGKYRCGVKHQSDTSRKSHNAIEINVQYPPDIGSVRFSKNSGAYQEYNNSYVLDEGDQIEVQTYIDSNPESSIGFNTSQYNQLSFDVTKNGYTARLPPLRCEDSGNHSIVADNGIKDSSKKIVKFVISCSPKYVKVSQDHIGAKIGDTVNITVHGVAYPKPTITWTRKNVVQVNDGKDNKDFTFNISYGIHIHREADFGVYNATIKNRLNALVVTIRVIAQDKPKTPVLTSDNVGFDGDQLHLNCESSVQRWPTYLRSSLQYNFSTAGGKHGNKLSINITRQDKGKQIYCQATDERGDVSNNSNIFTLDPYYGPDKPVLTFPHNQLNITEGSDMTAINCSADCYPQCSYEWERKVSGIFDTQFQVHSQTLKINNITRQDSGIYRCLVQHQNDTTRKSHSAIEINVQYPPDIKSVLFSKNAGGYQEYTDNFRFDEGEQTDIMTYIDSNPEPSIRLYTSNYRDVPLLLHTTNRGYTARLPLLRCEDSGNYLIVANNGIKDGVTKVVKLVISCSPKYVLVSQDKIGTRIGARENITVQGVAYPKPTISWAKNNVFKVGDENDNKDFTFNMTFRIYIDRKSDFGIYSVRIENRLYFTVVNISIQPEDKPGAPRNVSIVDISEFYVNISWIADFDGGKAQSFSIKYKAKSSNSWTFQKLDDYGNPKKGTQFYHKLVNLQPGTPYVVQVNAENDIGESHSLLNFTTTGLLQQQRTIMIGAIVGSLLFVVFLAVIFIIVRRKRGNSRGQDANDKVTYTKGTNQDESGTIEQNLPTNINLQNDALLDQNTENTYDIIEEEPEQKGLTGCSDNKYETLGKQEKPNLYQTLDKEQEQKGLPGCSDNKYETLGNQDKPNMYQTLDKEQVYIKLEDTEE